MTKQIKTNILLENMTELLEIPESAYLKATSRYEDIGEWLRRAESSCKKNDPHIFSQGSFRLGTAIRPLNENEEYDLDLACKLRADIGKSTHAQKDLKHLIGREIEAYRSARGIQVPVKEKHRCWRLEYQDDLSFHMDIVPCIPETEVKRQFIFESLKNAGENEVIANSVAQLTTSITDNRHVRYEQICHDWNISNPEGYATWFESRMNQDRSFIVEAQLDKIPLFKRKTPLQRAVQLLKRHRDQMFKGDPEAKPISIIITTLAARSYKGESDIESALRIILLKMGSLVNTGRPRVPNPVDPQEDFADRWLMPEYRHLNLEQNFWLWLKQAQTDIGLFDSDDVEFVTAQAGQKFSVHLDSSEVRKRLGLTTSSISIVTPKKHIISEPPTKPWRMS